MVMSSTPESEGLLPRPSSLSSENSIGEFSEKQDRAHAPRTRNALLFVLLGGLTVSLAANIGLAMGWRSAKLHLQKAASDDNRIELRYPAREAVEYEQVVFTSSIGDGTTAYQGPITDENEKLWEDLYEPLMSRISFEEAQYMPNRTAPEASAKEGSGYPVVLNVFHDIHCIHSLRKALFYFMDDKWTSENNPYSLHGSATAAMGHDAHDLKPEHLDHCIDALRQSAMCNGDITPNVWQYSPKVKQIRPRATIVHECRNFDKIKSWAREHAADNFKGFGHGPEVGLCAFDYPETCKTL